MKNVFFGLLLFCFSSVYMYGQEDVKLLLENITAEKYEKADDVVVFDSTSVFVEETGLSRMYMHKLIKVLNLKGAKKNNVFTINYDPLSAYVEIRQVLIHRKNGTVDTVTSKVCDYVAPARAIYWGASQKMIEIGRLEPEDAVEIWTYRKGYTYALLYDESDDAKYIPPMRGHFYDIVPFWSDVPLLEKSYIVNIQTNKNLYFNIYNGDIENKKEDVGDGRTKFSFVKKDIMPQKRESGMAAVSDVWTKLLMTTAPNWESKSLWFYGVNEDYGSFDPTPEVREKVSELLLGAVTELDSISILTHWVADNMRYSGISMGEGEGYTLHNCEMNYTDRCGVCKDKASLLIAMLRAAGFESYAAMTMAGERIEDIPADQFNHSITVVKRRNGQYELLDPTWVPFVRELWSSAEQQQGYLMGLPEGAPMMVTPISPAENHYFKMRAETTVAKDGTLTGEIYITAEGQTDAAVRNSMFARQHHSEWDKNVEKELLQISPRAQIISKTYTTTDNYLDGPVQITYKFKIPNYAIVTDKEIIFTPITARHPFGRTMRHLSMNTSMETREYPFIDRCSRLVEITETIKVPSFKSVNYYPENVSVKGEATSYEGGYQIDNKKIVFTENGRFEKRVYDAEDWPNYRKAVEAQKNFEIEPIILQR
ncbi:MAG: DUF3857 and transglutaminase domain-containing protein [Bacteroidales bacterium]|jgi:hypothetical protein|nr:DUF3857 and transglutaminase domain-containing protein [Bacteroidales bacterium]